MQLTNTWWLLLYHTMPKNIEEWRIVFDKEWFRTGYIILLKMHYILMCSLHKMHECTSQGTLAMDSVTFQNV
jgi:hypothetical protein